MIDKKDNSHHYNRSYGKTFAAPLDRKFVISSDLIWSKFQNILNKNPSSLVDLGCGGGTLLYNIRKINNRINLFGVDYSEVTYKHIKRWLHDVAISCNNIVHTDFNNESFDIVTSTMVIEHVDDNLFLGEVNRILKSNGIFLCTTVLKSKNARYFYKNEAGESVLETSHLREYESIQSFEGLLENNGFSVIYIDKKVLKYPLFDPFLKLLYQIFKSDFFRTFPAYHMNYLRRVFSIPIPGYYSLEVIAKKR